MNQKNDTFELYKELARAKFDDIKQCLSEIAFFKDVYSKELLSSETASVTLNIIKTLEEEHEQNKTEYNRLKAVSIGKVAP
jgi:hypothetical protein